MLTIIFIVLSYMIGLMIGGRVGYDKGFNDAEETIMAMLSKPLKNNDTN